ncbi:Rpn family recombination-promoting nuclease/putative transposase [Floridanema evergladense]|uniref:Rpn family recombination-promoting nuclease/putative transposase n=1 Tax=Floridaenema evergladense BLCC-F167 TaxID=3153639 RepID=A0ABV4WT36_9CYAN
MKTDAIFYELFKEFPNIFFELIGEQQTNPKAYQFIAPEIKQRSFRLDGLFSPLTDLSEAPLYFVEIQFYKDEEFYDRLFTSIFLYFSQYQPPNRDWYAIVIYDRRSNEKPIPPRYRALIEPHLRRFYLDELGQTASESLGVGIVKLVVESENQAAELAKQLINKTKVELTDVVLQQKVLEFIEAIIVYKFPNLSREEIEAMLNLNLIRQTKVYQEAKEEGKLEVVPKLLKRGFSIQEIAELLGVDVEAVRKNVEKG